MESNLLVGPSLPVATPAEPPFDVPAEAATSDPTTRGGSTGWGSILASAAVVLVLLAGSALAVLALAGRPDARRTLIGERPQEPSAAAPADRPAGLYVEIDIAANRLRLRRGDQLLREAVVSTGSGTVLRDPRDGRQWVFDTPLGERRVLGKRRNPVWTKPDWAFVEQGLVPPSGGPDRYDDVSLGDYALDLGDGYLIHGTLFQSLLGSRVTHGCVRVGDEDLEFLYRNTPVGTRVFLY